jgi:hypothetical protein
VKALKVQAHTGTMTAATDHIKRAAKRTFQSATVASLTLLSACAGGNMGGMGIYPTGRGPVMGTFTVLYFDSGTNVIRRETYPDEQFGIIGWRGRNVGICVYQTFNAESAWQYTPDGARSSVRVEAGFVEARCPTFYPGLNFTPVGRYGYR